MIANLSKLEQRLERLPTQNSLKQPLDILIKHIKALHLKFNSVPSEEIVITFSFFHTVSEKLTGKERLVLPMELEEIINKTLSFLDGNISVADYSSFAQLLPGRASTELEVLATIMLSLAVIAALGAMLTVAPAGIMGLAILSIASLLCGGLFEIKSTPSGLSQEVQNIAEAYHAGYALDCH